MVLVRYTRGLGDLFRGPSFSFDRSNIIGNVMCDKNE